MARAGNTSSWWNGKDLIAFVPAGFLVLALTLGGASREAPLPNLFLQFVAALLMVACLISAARNRAPQPWLVGGLIGIAIFAPALTALQLLPLPPGLWTSLPGRDGVAAGFALLDISLPTAPLSLDPQATLLAVGGFLAPLAVLTLGVTLAWPTFSRALRWGVVLMACAACLFGLAQAFLGRGGGLYLYASTNIGWPVGFFANVNHQATLMLMAMPFLAAAASHVRFGWAVGDRDMGLAAVVGAAAILLTTGLIAAGSEFGYWMFGPVVALSIMVYRGRDLDWRTAGLALVLGCVLVAGGVALWQSAIFETLGLERPAGLLEEDGRAVIFPTTLEAIKAYWPVGSGLGSFEAAYPSFEDPNEVNNSFVNMAHNEYLQILMEYGAAGAVLIALGVGWWAAATIQVWLASDRDDIRLRRAASIALGVVLVHSLVDYPARTAAIACLAMACAVLMAAPSRESTADRRERKEGAIETVSKAHVDL